MPDLPIIRFTVSPLSENDPRSAGLLTDSRAMGLDSIQTLRSVDLFFIQGALDEPTCKRLAHELLTDPVTQRCVWRLFQPSSSKSEVGVTFEEGASSCLRVEVALRPGVTDPVAEQLIRAAHEIGILGVERVCTGQQITVTGQEVTSADLQTLARRLLANPVIQRYVLGTVEPIFMPGAASSGQVEVIPLRALDDRALEAISIQRRAALDLAEMKAIQAYYTAEGRDPTDVEFEALAQTWSEHCVHKTFKSRITLVGEGFDFPYPPVVDNLFNTYIRRATQILQPPWLLSAFTDNAGILAFDDQFEVSFKVETHNHPSAIEPFGGANTGVGGVIRDILGVSAKPIANTDVLCFGPQDAPLDTLAEGVLHPRRIQSGVVAGVQDYGNKMGIPTVNGAIWYDPGFTANPLVFCGCVGIAPRGRHPRQPLTGDRVILLGGRTGRDGLRGATFSSMTMDAQTGEVAGASVQIGDPITEKGVLEVILKARDQGLYHAITDCGAGGLSSAVGEMANPTGVDVDLAQVRLKYPGLAPWEIWLSEAQERMVLAIPPASTRAVKDLCALYEVDYTDLGSFTGAGRLLVRFAGQPVLDLSCDFLHEGIPQRQLVASRPVLPPPTSLVEHSGPLDLPATLLALLSHPNIASKAAVIRQYDHEVQGGTVVKPLTGVANDGPADACVLKPIMCQGSTGLVLSNGLNPEYGKLDAYRMALCAIDEAVRNAVAVGADPDCIALLDNFCWGDPRRPEVMGALLEATRGCYEGALRYKAPFISGKDSFNNEYLGADGQRHSIPPTLLISAIGIIPDVTHTVTLDLKQAGHLLYRVGDFHPVFGGSHYAMIKSGLEVNYEGTQFQAPQPPASAPQVYRALHQAIAVQRVVLACHDLSEGGLLVAAAEMAIAGRLGLRLAPPPSADLTTWCFGEVAGCLLVEVAPEDVQTFETLMAGLPCEPIGRLSADGSFTLDHPEHPFSLPIDQLVMEPPGRAPTRGAPTVGVPLVGTLPRLPRVGTPTLNRALRPPKALILHASGTNRDLDVAQAFELAGALPEIVHLNTLRRGDRRWADYQVLVLPGGFSYGDALGAGKLLAIDLKTYYTAEIEAFIQAGKPVIGICNGFQALVKSGLLASSTQASSILAGGQEASATLTFNQSGAFECRWVYLDAPASTCLWTQDLDELIYCPVAHGEGCFSLSHPEASSALFANRQVALVYANPDGGPADGGYPANPNGSMADIAGLCNPAGNVLGLMPHPENHIFPYQHPRYHRAERGGSGLQLFKNGVIYAREM